MDSDTRLIETIRQNCEVRGWYGADLRGPEWENALAADDPRKTHFQFPTASLAQLQKTEMLLGFALPPFLRMIYTKIANGGFGPAYGIRGAIDGFADATGTIVQHYQSLCEDRSLLDLQLGAEVAQDSSELVIPFEQWPRGLFSICEWGCAIQISLDSATGRIYRVEPSRDGYHITHEAESLQAWIEQWIHAKRSV
jgi:hypothetical protein